MRYLYPDFGAFVVGPEFTDVGARGQSMPFYGDFPRVDKNPRDQRVTFLTSP